MKHAAIAIPGIDRVGGAERQAMLLAEGLRSRDWRVSVVALTGAGGAAAAELRRCGVEFVSLEMRKGLADPRGWVRMYWWLKHERPDVVHAHLPHAAWLARWLRLGADVPVVIDTLHTSSVGGMGRRIGYTCSRWLPDHVTAVSHAAAEAHLAAGMVRGGRLSVVGNGVDIDTWRPDPQARAEIRRELGLTDEFLWVAVGRLEPVKDYPTLLRAMARTPETAQLAILGAGPLQNELVRLASELGLARRVRLLGFEPNVKRWMQAADGFALSSCFEGLPMALLEAGACALPAVATNVAGTREVILEGVNGLLTGAGDAHHLGRAMVQVMNMPAEERSIMGLCARRLVIRRFSMEAILDRWECLYGELLRRKSGVWRNWRRDEESLSRQSAASA